MFITGPDVIKTVTHEEVTKEKLGGAMTHNSKIRCRALRRRRRSRRADVDPRDAAVLHAVEQHGGSARRASPPTTTRRPRGRAARTRWSPTIPTSRTTSSRRHRVGRRRRTLSSRCTSTSPRTSSSASRAWAASRSASWPTSRPCWPACSTSTPRSRVRASFASATASTFRWSFSRTCRVSAGHGSGVRRDHQARRQAALRLRRGHGAQADRDHAQGLRRRLLRDGQQAHPHRLQLRLALGRDRGDGLRGRGQHRVPPRSARKPARRRRGGAPAEGRRVPREVRQPLHRRRARLRRRGDRARADAAQADRGLQLLENKRDTNPPEEARQHPAVQRPTRVLQKIRNRSGQCRRSRRSSIANRGEIAVRIIRACARDGHRTVAVYSDADRTALHVRFRPRGLPHRPAGAPARATCDIDRIIDAAKALRCRGDPPRLRLPGGERRVRDRPAPTRG